MDTIKKKKTLLCDSVYKKCPIYLVNLSEEDIKNCKLCFTKTKNNNSKGDEPAQKKLKVDTNGIGDSKLVLSRERKTDTFKSQFKSPLKHNGEILSTSTEMVVVPMQIDRAESTESVNSSANQVLNNISTFKPRKLMSDDQLKFYTNGFLDNLSKDLMYRDNKLELPNKLSLNNTKVNDNYYNKIENIIEFEKLYTKYFSKFLQDTIVAIANIMDIILTFDNYHRARLDKDVKKIYSSVNPNKKYDANQLHAKNKKILESILNELFVHYIIPRFVDSEFESVFQMFFLSLLKVFRALNRPKSNETIYFDDLALLLMNSLKNSQFPNSQLVFSMLQSWEFQSACINVFRMIEKSRHSDPGITDRLPIFFVSTLNNRKYFQGVIDAVTNDYNGDLVSIIDNAYKRNSINSTFKDPTDLSTKKQFKDKTPVTATIQSPINSDEKIHYRAKHVDGTLRISNRDLMQVTASSSGTAISSTITTAPYMAFAPSQKVRVSILHGALVEGKNISLANQLHEVTKVQPRQMRSEVIDSNMLAESPSSNIIERRDFYDGHNNNCERPLNNRRTQL